MQQALWGRGCHRLVAVLWNAHCLLPSAPLFPHQPGQILPLLCSEDSNGFPSHSECGPKASLWPTRPYSIWSPHPTNYSSSAHSKPAWSSCTCQKRFHCLLLPLPGILQLYILNICSLFLVNLVSNVTLSVRPALTILHKIASSNSLDSYPAFSFFISCTTTWYIQVCTCLLTIPSQALSLLGSLLYPSSQGHTDSW